MSSAWSQLEQLLTCAICLDRFRNPKLLPCQHTFCADPCMEGLQDYARRQIKCPECRAEHRIPYNGIQTFPTNVTLVRFLELHRSITGEEPEPVPSSMERCNVCSEKSYVEKCSHCEKKICEVCKEAHLDIMRREISRINNQVRRGLNRLNETLAQNSKNQEKLRHNCALVKEELDDLINRYIKDLQVIQDKLKNEIDNYLEQELKQLARLAEDVDTELANISSNCDVVEKYVSEDAEWTDAELVEYKEIFGKSLEFLRNFDPDTSDFTRRVKLQIHTDPDALHRTLCNLGELKFSGPPALSVSASTLSVPQYTAPAPGMNALMRSQSDHRLAVQFQKKQDSRSMLDIGQRYGGHLSDSERDPAAETGSLYGRGRNQDSILRRYQDRSREQDAGDPGRRYERSWRNSEDGGSGHHSGFRSRYARELMEDDPDSSSFLTRNVRFEEPPSVPHQRERIFDTDDAIRGPLSGVVKLSDSAKFMERIHENEIKRKQKEAERERQEREPPPPAPAPVPPPRRPPSRQMSEDEVEKQKKAANQAAASTSSTATPTSPPAPTTPVDTRPSQVRRLVKDDQASRTPPDSPRTPSSPRQGSVEGTPVPSRRSSTASEDTTASDTGYRPRQRRANAEDATPKTQTTQMTSANSTSRSPRAPMAKAVSLDQDRRPAGTTTAEKREDFTSRTSSTTQPPAAQQSSFFSRSRQPPPAPQHAPKVGQEEGSSSEATSTEETTESEEEEEEEEEEEDDDDEDDVTIEERTSTTRKPAVPIPQTRRAEEVEASSSVSALLNRSAQARRGSQDIRTATPPESHRDGPNRQSQYARDKEEESRRLPDRYRSWRESPSASVDEAPSRYQSSYLANRRRPTLTEDDDDVFGSGNSRFLSRSKSSALVGRDDDSPDDRRERRRSQQDLQPEKTAPSSVAAALRRSRLARSKSSNELLPGELESPEDTTPTSSVPYRSRYGSEDAGSNALSRSKSSHVVKDTSPEVERNGPGSSSTWAQYLRNKYGNRGGSTSLGGSRPSAAVARSRSSHTLYGRSGSDEENSSEEDLGSRARRRSYGDGIGGSYGSPRAMYLQKKRMQIKIGTRGTEPGCFTWPRGVAVGPDSSIVVADSSNHRVQVFDCTGRFQHEFGTYGSAEGEFDCLAGVAVNRIGQFIVSDRYNHRIQVFDPSGRFLRSFGCEGRVDGRFNYPWGITTDSLGFIYVCDKENHRVQVFQSDGTFVGKFGTLGSRPGQLEHPHYVAVSNTNRVIVSDSNNHRIQIFDVNGRSLSSFGSEGSDDGHFKFPRGVAVDDQGYIIVGDSGNNRIQVFAPDGSFLRAFGSWGSGDGEFKGLEGIAVMPSGGIVVCDRENHRVQVF